MRLRDRRDYVENFPCTLFVHNWKVKLGTASTFRLLISAAELAGEEAAGKRAPD
jgi:hypothetical protein